MHAAVLFPLLAEADSFLYLGDRFRSENAALGPISVGLAGIVGVVAILLYWGITQARSKSANQTIDHPWKLLRELTHAHALSKSQERLLHRMIRQYEIEPPGRLLLEPDRFQHAAADAAFAGERLAILRLKERLFESR